MIAVLQRVHSASVIADGEPAGRIDKGLFILLGVLEEDTEEDARLLAEKIAKLRIFSDENDKMNLSVVDIGGGALVVSNFTLAANYAKGNRPDYLRAAPPAVADPLYQRFSELLRERVGTVENGVFGAHMDITVAANGPVTIVMDSAVLRKGGRA
ncbi:MAG: D-tyrosyl-tRNA(Tyr) deacylase [Clostridia bacterium]|nr:D-tyrosyl-tRNA(Tyr) deacylase [Clostridia bacterium]